MRKISRCSTVAYLNKLQQVGLVQAQEKWVGEQRFISKPAGN